MSQKKKFTKKNNQKSLTPATLNEIIRYRLTNYCRLFPYDDRYWDRNEKPRQTQQGQLPYGGKKTSMVHAWA